MKKKNRNAGPPITLYHFCAAHSLRSILAEGLTLGMTPVFENGEMHIEHGTQWLTADKNPQRQSWHTHTLVPYSRTAYRLTVNIPHSRRKKLLSAAEHIQRFPEENKGLVENWPGSEHWYVYAGKIPPEWIVGYKRTEA